MLLACYCCVLFGFDVCLFCSNFGRVLPFLSIFFCILLITPETSTNIGKLDQLLLQKVMAKMFLLMDWKLYGFNDNTYLL